MVSESCSHQGPAEVLLLFSEDLCASSLRVIPGQVHCAACSKSTAVQDKKQATNCSPPTSTN